MTYDFYYQGLNIIFKKKIIVENNNKQTKNNQTPY